MSSNSESKKQKQYTPVLTEREYWDIFSLGTIISENPKATAVEIDKYLTKSWLEIIEGSEWVDEWLWQYTGEYEYTYKDGRDVNIYDAHKSWLKESDETKAKYQVQGFIKIITTQTAFMLADLQKSQDKFNIDWQMQVRNFKTIISNLVDR